MITNGLLARKIKSAASSISFGSGNIRGGGGQGKTFSTKLSATCDRRSVAGRSKYAAPIKIVKIQFQTFDSRNVLCYYSNLDVHMLKV